MATAVCAFDADAYAIAQGVNEVEEKMTLGAGEIKVTVLREVRAEATVVTVKGFYGVRH